MENLNKVNLEKKFRGYNTNALQNRLKKTESEVEKEIISAILAKRGVLTIAEGVKGYAYEEPEGDFAVEEAVEEPKAKKVHDVVVLSNGLNVEKFKPEYFDKSVEAPEMQVGAKIEFERKKNIVRGTVQGFYFRASRKIEEIIFIDQSGKRNTVRTVTLLKKGNYKNGKI